MNYFYSVGFEGPQRGADGPLCRCVLTSELADAQEARPTEEEPAIGAILCFIIKINRGVWIQCDGRIHFVKCFCVIFSLFVNFCQVGMG